MTLATAYTEATLAEYMQATLLETADVLGWSDAGHDAYTTAVGRVARAYGAEIEDADDLARLEALARREIWRSVVAATAWRYDITSGEENLKRSQINAQARANLADAERDVAVTTTTPDEGRSTLGTTSAPVAVGW